MRGITIINDQSERELQPGNAYRIYLSNPDSAGIRVKYHPFEFQHWTSRPTYDLQVRPSYDFQILSRSYQLFRIFRS